MKPTMELPTVKHMNECFIKPKLEENSSKPYFLSSWDLKLLSIHYNQKGLLFTKPTTPKDEPSYFSFNNLFENLKESLALTLVHFYPLAGQLVTQFDEDQHKCLVFVDCNQGSPGARFLHATLDMTVSDILSPTNIPKVVHSLFGHDHDNVVVNLDGRSRPLLSIQVTELVDGVFIGCSMNHAIVDGTSFRHFWKVWSEIHNTKNTSSPFVSRPPLMIGKDSPLLISLTNDDQLDELVVRYEPQPELMERMFHFTSDSMKRLKEKANKDVINNKNVTISSFQALAALIWRAVVRSYELAPNEVTNCHLAVNVRNRLDPPLPENYFGNALGNIKTSITSGELLTQNLGLSALLLNETIKKYTVGGSVGDHNNTWAKDPSFVDLSSFTDLRGVRFGSSPRFEIYGNEFSGLGRPVAVRSGKVNKFVGKVNTYPGCEGSGSVDFEICLLPHQMAILESDHEFMGFVHLTI